MPRPGLRGRVAASLILTAAIALGVAAFALLAPLERNLRAQELHDLVAAAVQSRSSFRELDVNDGKRLNARLRLRVRRVAAATGARVALLDPSGRVLANTDPDAHDRYRDAFAALRTNRAVRRIVDTGGSTPQARVALRVPVEGTDYVLALRKGLTEQRTAVVHVRSAFVEAALVALAVALLLSALFAATAGRRLRALRDAVQRFHISGRRGTLPQDRAADEVGDLSRAFAELAVRLQREEAIRSEFVSTASHELRTPLMALQGRLEILADELARARPNLEEGRRQLGEARSQADRLGRLAADLLDLSRLDAEVELRHEELDLAEIAEAVASEFAAPLAELDRELTEELEPVHVEADPTACARVVRVLLDNALRYSPPDAPIALRVGQASGSGIVTVSDGGPGIPAADRERIFERFARGSEASPAGGFGLGLAIARELSERMGGSLDVADGRGTTFALRLPLSARRPNEIPTQASPA